MDRSEQQYISLYNSVKDDVCKYSAEVINSHRDEAFRKFCDLGFPSQKEERYKYTDVQKAFAPDYGVNVRRVRIPVNPYDTFKCDVPNLSTLLFFIDNDEFYANNSVSVKLQEGVVVESLKTAAEKMPELVGKYYNRLAKEANDGITALNTTLSQDGLFVYVPKNTKLDHTLQIINLLHSSVDMMVNRRVLVVLEEGAEATLLFCDHAMDRSRFLATQVIEVFAADNSRLDMYELEETHTSCTRFSNLYAEIGNDCSASFSEITLFNGKTRNTSDIVLKGRRSEVNLYGCVIADKSQNVDNNTLIDHQAPDCTSNELYKYVVDDYAVGAFAGRILVRKDAQKTVSQETNANLCATKSARVYSQPMLEIYADDVKCSHGSTVGVLDDNALFYMQQRGISESEARMLLKFAFVGQVVDCISLTPLRDRIHYLVEKRFRGELNKCTGCALCK